MFLEIVFRLEAKIIKLKAGHRFFLCQCAKAFPANIIFVAPPLKAILSLVSPVGGPHSAREVVGTAAMHNCMKTGVYNAQQRSERI